MPYTKPVLYRGIKTTVLVSSPNSQFHRVYIWYKFWMKETSTDCNDITLIGLHNRSNSPSKLWVQSIDCVYWLYSERSYPAGGSMLLPHLADCIAHVTSPWISNDGSLRRNKMFKAWVKSRKQVTWIYENWAFTTGDGEILTNTDGETKFMLIFQKMFNSTLVTSMNAFVISVHVNKVL